MTDFYNFTFNSLGSIGAILLLNLFSIPHIEKSSVFFLNISSLMCIVCINSQYCIIYATVVNITNKNTLCNDETKNIKIINNSSPINSSK